MCKWVEMYDRWAMHDKGNEDVEVRVRWMNVFAINYMECDRS